SETIDLRAGRRLRTSGKRGADGRNPRARLDVHLVDVFLSLRAAVQAVHGPRDVAVRTAILFAHHGSAEYGLSLDLGTSVGASRHLSLLGAGLICRAHRQKVTPVSLTCNSFFQLFSPTAVPPIDRELPSAPNPSVPRP